MTREKCRSRNTGFIESGLTVGEARHLRHACATLLQSLTDKQLELRAELVVDYIKRGRRC